MDLSMDSFGNLKQLRGVLMPLFLSLLGVFGYIGRYCWIWALAETTTLPAGDRLKTSTHYICYLHGGSVLGSHAHQTSLYVATVFDNLTVFIGRDEDVMRLFRVTNISVHRTEDLCQEFGNKFESHCCAYSPILMPISHDRGYRAYNNLQSWEYTYTFTGDFTEPYKIQDWLKVKSKSIKQTFKFRHSMRTNWDLILEGTHECRGDVPFDPYPEIHLSVTLTQPSDQRNYAPKNITQQRHWYL